MKSLKKSYSIIAIILFSISVNAQTKSFKMPAIESDPVAVNMAPNFKNKFESSDSKDYNTVLPVNYLSFTSSVNQKRVLLNWNTTSLHNTSDFIVQRSSNNMDWENIAVVSASEINNSTAIYYFIDEEPVNGINYYRLSQNDLVSDVNFSQSVSANFKYSNGLLKIYSSSIENGLLTISLIKNATINIYSNSGSKLMQETFKAGKQTIDVTKFAKGNYFIKVDKQTEVFVIQ